jgi:hypothetical protein
VPKMVRLFEAFFSDSNSEFEAVLKNASKGLVLRQF